MRFVLLAGLTLLVAFGLKEWTRQRRDDLVPHGYPESGPPADRLEPDDTMVTVARLSRAELAVAQGLLSSAGIPSSVQPPGPGVREWHKPMRLQVRAVDAEDATILLRDVRGERPDQAPG